MSAEDFVHESVMPAEVLAALSPQAGERYVDATLGGAGHSHAILSACGPDGVLYGIDRDPLALDTARERLSAFGERAQLVHGGFGDVRQHLSERGVTQVAGLVADLGVSSPQLDRAERGFSFSQEGPLDMRMDTTQGPTALDLLHEWSESELADVLYRYGEERRSRPIARSIKAALELGEVTTTSDLRRTVVRVLGPRRKSIDPATRTFQALRMAVNREMEELEALMQALPDVLQDGGVAVIISFHSGEDRVVKHGFREDPRLEPLTKKPQVATDEERDGNPRSRSAKLRAARRLPREVSP